MQLTRRTLVKTTAATAATMAIGIGGVARSVTAQDAAYPELTIIATDHAFDMPEQVEGGMVRIVLDNQGEEDHHAILFRINDDATLEQFEEALMSGDVGGVVAASTAYAGPNVGPGVQGSVVTQLDAGTYMVVCIIPDANGVPHAAHGMVSMLEVTEGGAEREQPEADASIELVDMAFPGLPNTVDAGMQTWEVVNNGQQLHEIVVLQVPEGVSADAYVEGMLGQGDQATPAAEATPAADAAPVAHAIGGTSPMHPGQRTSLELDLESGEYVAICFIPDGASGVPHFLMGMIAPFAVS